MWRVTAELQSVPYARYPVPVFPHTLECWKQQERSLLPLTTCPGHGRVENSLQHFFRLKGIATAVPKRPEPASSSSSPQELMITTLASCADCR